MGLSEKLTEIKSEANALITYANGTTHAGDTTLGDAIQTLIDGYGQGGVGNIQIYEADIEITQTSNTMGTYDIFVPFDTVYFATVIIKGNPSEVLSGLQCSFQWNYYQMNNWWYKGSSSNTQNILIGRKASNDTWSVANASISNVPNGTVRIKSDGAYYIKTGTYHIYAIGE